MSTLMQGQAEAIEYLKSYYAFVEVDHQGNAVKVSWGHYGYLTNKGLEFLSTLTTIVELSLGQMTDARLDYLSKLVNLKRLSFQTHSQHSHITDEGLSYLTPLVNLEYLDLGNLAHITDQGLTHLVNLKKLQSLHLSGSDITAGGLKQLKGLSELRYLGVPETLPLEYVQYFPKLEDVVGLDTNDEQIKYLSTLNNLQELWVGPSTFETPSTPLVTDASVKTLIKLKTLKILAIWNSHITKQGLKELQNELPNCEIDVDIINEEIGTPSELRMKAMERIKSRNMLR